MSSLRAILLILALAAGQVSATAIKSCDARNDNCIKALNGCGSKNRKQVSTDCSKFVWKTVTPAPVVITKTSTKTRTATSTIAYIVTQSTTGGTVFETVTNVVSIVPSTIVNVTSPANTPAAVKRLARRDPILFDVGFLAKGKACAPSIPSYAKSCKDVTRYASACSCYGVPAQTSTVPARTTTCTTTVTSTSFSLVSTATATAYITAPATTQTATVTSTTSNNANPTTLSLFDLQVFNAPGTTQKLYVRKAFGFQVSNIDDFLGFILEPNGRVYTPNGRRSYFFCVLGDSGPSAPASITNGVFNDPNSPPAFPGQELLCNLDANQVLSCQCTVSGTTYTELIFNNYFQDIDHGLVYVATSGYPLGASQAALTAQAYPFDWDGKCGYHMDDNGNDWDQECSAAYVDPKFAEDLSDTGGFES